MLSTAGLAGLVSCAPDVVRLKETCEDDVYYALFNGDVKCRNDDFAVTGVNPSDPSSLFGYLSGVIVSFLEFLPRSLLNFRIAAVYIP